MSDNKPNAFSALKAVAQPTIPEAPAVDANVVQLTHPAPVEKPIVRAPRTKPEPKKFTRPGRTGMKVIAIHVDPQMARQLKILAAETDSTIQAIAEAAIREKLATAGKKV